jgi:N-acetylglucosaminyldiphosphoundecaprenol N-acetyl-beta-D-mannosaminyltransferase
MARLIEDLTKNITLCDIPIYKGDMDDLKNTVRKIIGGNYSPIQIVTLNTDILRISDIDDELKAICMNSPLVLPDGIGIALLSKIKYNILLNRVTGNDILNIILNLSLLQGLRIAFLGASEWTLANINSKIKSRGLNVEITNLISPPENFETNDALNNEIVEQLRIAKPEILFVALGCPRQEKWINKHKDEIGIKIGVGVGAALDYYAGSRRRSPLILQKVGLEWLWRLISEPRRMIKRYLIQDIPFLIKKIIELR